MNFKRNRTTFSSSVGFTLLEILVAMAILAMSLIAIITNQIQAVQLYDSTKNLTIATQLAKQKMNELILEFKGKDVGEIPEEKKGDFKDTDFEEFKWNMTFKSDEEFEKIGKVLTAKNDISKMIVDQMSGSGMDPNKIAELLGNAIKKLTVTIEWTTTLDDGEVSVWQHYIDDKAQMPGQNVGPTEPGPDDKQTPKPNTTPNPHPTDPGEGDE